MTSTHSVPSHPSLALIGAGNWGKNLARNFHAQGALHAICDIHEARLDACSILYPEVALTTNYQSILKNPLISKVAIATPLSSHYPLARQALLSGKDVFVEKPLCLDEREARELADLADKNRLILMIGHILNYHPHINFIQDLVKKETLGSLQYLAARRCNPINPNNQEDALWDLAPHDISLVLSLWQQRAPRTIQCTHAVCNSLGAVEEAHLTLEFGSNLAQAQIYISRLSPVKEQKIMIVCSKASLVFDDTKPWEEKLVMVKGMLNRNFDSTVQRGNIQPQALLVPQVEPLKRECSHFLECCANRTTPITHAREALKVIQILQAAQACIQKERSKNTSFQGALYQEAQSRVNHANRRLPS